MLEGSSVWPKWMGSRTPIMYAHRVTVQDVIASTRSQLPTFFAYQLTPHNFGNHVTSPLEGRCDRNLRMTSELTFILEPNNSLEMTADDLEPLIREIQAILEKGDDVDDVEVIVYAEDPYGVANDFQEVLNVFLPNAEIIRTAVWSSIELAIVGFMKARFKRPHEQKRTRKNFIYGPDGEILKSVTIENEEDDPTWDDEGPHRDPPHFDNRG